MTDKLTLLDRTRIQMQYVIPLIRDLQSILGEDVINNALEERSHLPKPTAPGSKADFTRMQRATETFAEGGALDYDVVASDNDHFDMNVTHCNYAVMMEELGARDIGHLLICNLDYAAADKIGMTLERNQTKMQGASHCDFRYRRKGD